MATPKTVHEKMDDALTNAHSAEAELEILMHFYEEAPEDEE
jgi:hypothetical protein